MGICNFRSIKEKNLIFLHSLFRTGSTYFWSKFRKQKHIACYYEPLNEQLLEEKRRVSCESAESLKHSFIKEGYFLEYIDKIKCTNVLKQNIIIDEFCYIKSIKTIKKYINCLIKATSKKNVLFQFNRAALRTKWFKENYKDSTNIYIYRNFRDQWRSIIDQKRKGNPYFIIMNLMIVSRSLWHDFMKPLDSAIHIPVLACTKGQTEKEKFQFNYNFFYNQLNYLSIEMHYLIHYYLWKICLAYNRKQADICIDMTKLNKDRSYRGSVQEVIANRTKLDIDFSDINLPRYENYGIGIMPMQCMEREVEHRLNTVELAKILGR